MYQIYFHFFREPSHTMILCVQQAKNTIAARHFINYIIAQGWHYDAMADENGTQVYL